VANLLEGCKIMTVENAIILCLVCFLLGFISGGVFSVFIVGKLFDKILMKHADKAIELRDKIKNGSNLN
jgi:hypothetical protein